MRSKIITLSISLLAGAFWLINPVLAGDEAVAFTFGESGPEVSFEMSGKDVKAQNKVLMAASRPVAPKFDQPKIWVDMVELAESAVMFKFSLSKEEIELAKAKEAKKIERGTAYKKQVKPNLSEKFKLSESGFVIEFPLPQETARSEMMFAEEIKVDDNS
jgi:hypothetical protein